ncbi:igLON family member 5-like [Orbicella faveolata]|uniref:igLON family member 5-like n=1 Tax=Orbicella faveolata TaxID=48498 RepID=UPI0009E24755|nr:igLON family member 5-like [Orbicella faveolata]
MGLGTVIKTMENTGQFVFRCEANNSVQDGGRSSDTILNVLAPPATVKQAENKIAVEGTDVEVYCNVTGIPDPTVIWRNVKTCEIIEGNLLNITNITRAQTGEYKCTASNTCGVDSTMVNINVHYKPNNVHLTTNTTNEVCAGIIINFTCSAEANPAVHTYLLSENDTVIYNMGLGTVIKTMENAGQFVFRCEANNSVGDTGTSSDTSFTVLGELAKLI